MKARGSGRGSSKSVVFEVSAAVDMEDSLFGDTA
jgi:hypothetical protein